MLQGWIAGLWLALAALAANLPWLSDRWLLVLARDRVKPGGLRLLEWLLLYGLILGIGFGFEYKATGVLSQQGWEFYTVTACLFAVAALPGFIYRYQLRRLLEHASR
jgi:hypothetical protein